MPAVDEAPTAAHLLAQAADQAAANPQEAVRLLTQVLDDWGARMVAVPGDDSLYVRASDRVETALFADATLLRTFRKEEEARARALLQAGNLDRVVATRLATAAGLDAALLQAQAALARGRFATAASILARASRHDLLVGEARLHHAAMLATALHRLGDSAGAAKALAAAEAVAAAQDAPSDAPAVLARLRAELAAAPSTAPATASAATSGLEWGEIWRVQLEGAAPVTNLDLTAPDMEESVRQLLPVPAADALRVYANDGVALHAVDRMSGRPLWARSMGSLFSRAQDSVPTLRYAAPLGDAVVTYTTASSTAGRPGSASVVCCDAANGSVRWETGLDFSDGRGVLTGVVPVGEPLVVDGRVVVAARRLGTRAETVSWLFCLDARQQGALAWSAVVATAGSVNAAIAGNVETPVRSGAGIYLATATGAVARFDPATGTVVWLRRFAVPLRMQREEAWDVLSPAVADGKVFAVTPDGARVVVLDAATGAPLHEIPTGIGTPLRAPHYLVGAEGSTLVAAVGEEVVVFDATAPDQPLWSWKPGPADPLRGRVAWGNGSHLGNGAGAAAAHPVLLVPHGEQTAVLAGRTGDELLSLDLRGNPILLPSQVVSSSASSLASMMPLEEAERLCRLRLQNEPTAEAALSLLQLARQAKRGALAAEAATLTAQRLQSGQGSAQAQLEFLELLLAVDAAGFATGADAAVLERVLDAAADAAKVPGRAALARADRMVRAKDFRNAARVLATLAVTEPQPALVETPTTTVSLQALALDRLRALAQQDPGAMDLARRAVPERPGGDAPAEQRVAALRTAARVAAAAGDTAALQRLLDALKALDPMVATLLQDETAAAPVRDLVSLPGTPLKSLEFPGMLPAWAPGVSAPRDRVYSMVGQTLALRRPPEFQPAAQAPVDCSDPVILSCGPSLILWDERAAGYGQAFALGADDLQPLWRTPRTAAMFGRLSPGGDESEPTIRVQAQRTAPLAQVLPGVCDRTLVLVRRDGAIQALDAADGRTLRWKRPGGDLEVQEALFNQHVVVLACNGVDGSAPHLVCLEASTGALITDFPLSDDTAPDLLWVRLTPSGLLLLGSSDGIEARQLASGAQTAPLWRCQASEAQVTMGAWVHGRWLLAQDRFDQLVALDLQTGRIAPTAFRTKEADEIGVIRALEFGAGWVAVVREDHVDCFDAEGHFLGRDAGIAARSFVAGFPAKEQLICLDASPESVPGLEAQQFACELVRLDPAAGGKLMGPPAVIRSMGQRISAARAIHGWLLLSNGLFVQAVDFRTQGTPGRNPG